MPYIKEKIDTRSDRAGQYLLTGSQNILLVEKITESLAGRAAILRLLPLSFREAAGQPQTSLPWEPETSFRAGSKIACQDLWKGFVRGSYPELVADPGRDIQLWHSSYIQTYLERDVRSLRQVSDLSSHYSATLPRQHRKKTGQDTESLFYGCGNAMPSCRPKRSASRGAGPHGRPADGDSRII